MSAFPKAAVLAAAFVLAAHGAAAKERLVVYAMGRNQRQNVFEHLLLAAVIGDQEFHLRCMCMKRRKGRPDDLPLWECAAIG